MCAPKDIDIVARYEQGLPVLVCGFHFFFIDAMKTTSTNNNAVLENTAGTYSSSFVVLRVREGCRSMKLTPTQTVREKSMPA